MKATVTYTENGASKQISVEAADMETIKSAVSQWTVTERRLSHRILNVTKITPIVSTFGKAFNIA
jgi:hypothetical protein